MNVSKCVCCKDPASHEVDGLFGRTDHLCDECYEKHTRYAKEWRYSGIYDYYETYGMKGGFDYGSD